MDNTGSKALLSLSDCADLDTCELTEDPVLDTVTRFYLAVLLRHGNLMSVVESEYNM